MSLLTLIHGSAHQIDIPDKSVQCIVTSPPYWGLRKYAGDQGIEWPTVEYAPMAGLAPLRIQGCEPECAHEWADGPIRAYSGGGSNASNLDGSREYETTTHFKTTQGAYCLHCGGWRGELGLEPTPEMYIAHLILCLREWKRVLRDDGTCWVNLGDSYNGSGGAGGDYGAGGLREGQPKYPGRKVGGLKPKDLCGIPWRFAFAAQADGWYLRSDCIWAKPNPMPESVGDRPTKSHEYIFLLSKNQNYYFDADAVREDYSDKTQWTYTTVYGGGMPNGKQHGSDESSRLRIKPNNTGRNLRTVWTIATQPTPFAHFATYPEKIPETAILAGTSARGCCPKCGAPYARCVELGEVQSKGGSVNNRRNGHTDFGGSDMNCGVFIQREHLTIGWQPSCTCNAGEPVPCVTLDPFHGSGTTGKVAIRLGRRYIGVDISEEYLNEITAQRFADGIQMELTL